MGASRRRLAAGMALAGMLVVLLLGVRHASGREQPAHAAQASATIAISKGSTKLPRSFFGFSVEYPELPMYAQFPNSFVNVLRLLKVGDDGPQVLRIGGDSADLTYWNPGWAPLPPGAHVLTPTWFGQAGALIAQAGLRALVDLNLKSSSPQLSARLAREAISRFPRGSVIGLQVGNEPDRYGNGYSPARYVRDFKTYARVLARTAPGVPVLGPAVTSTSGNFNWIRAVFRGDRRQVGVLDGHRYPLSNCARPGTPGFPTLGKILGAGLTNGLAQSVKPAVVLAHRGRLAFRLDEVNSVTCGGKPGVSDTFATALWAPDALFSLLKAGLDAVNVHIRPTKINGPLVVGPAGFRARPLFYGLLLFARTLSPGGRLLHLDTRLPRPEGLSAWSVRVRGNAIHVLLINKRTAPVTVHLRLPRSSTVTVEQMLAGSASATGGVTLAGQRLGPDGTLQGPLVAQTLSPGPGGYALTVPGASAALVQAQPG